MPERTVRCHLRSNGTPAMKSSIPWVLEADFAGPSMPFVWICIAYRPGNQHLVLFSGCATKTRANAAKAGLQTRLTTEPLSLPLQRRSRLARGMARGSGPEDQGTSKRRTAC